MPPVTRSRPYFSLACFGIAIAIVLMSGAWMAVNSMVGAQEPPADEPGWESSEPVMLHGNPRKGSKISLRRNPETGEAILRVIAVIESGGDAQWAEGVTLTVNGKKSSLDCRFRGSMNVFQQIDAQPFDIEISATHATSDCELEPGLLAKILDATEIGVALRLTAAPLKPRTLKRKQLQDLTELTPVM